MTKAIENEGKYQKAESHQQTLPCLKRQRHNLAGQFQQLIFKGKAKC